MILKLLLNTHSNYMDGIYENIREYNPNKRRKVLIVFDYLIFDMLNNKNLNSNRSNKSNRKKLNISFVFITRSYFAAPKNIVLNSIHYFIMKFLDQQKLQ